MLTDSELQTLEQIEGLLHYPASFDHDCGDDQCTLENPSCGEMHVRAALEQLRAFLEPAHDSLHHGRQVNQPERLFIQHWQTLNRRDPAVNNGYTALELILHPEGQAMPARRVSQRDAEVAASVIQWLGTSCGKAFLSTVERDIDRQHAESRAWFFHPGFAFRAEPADWCREHAERIVCGAIPPGSSRERTVHSTASAIEQLLLVIAVLSGQISGAAAAEQRDQLPAEFMKTVQRAQQKAAELYANREAVEA